MHPGAAYGSRRWPAARFAEVARWLASRGHPVVITGGPGERELAQRVAAPAGRGGATVLAGRTTLPQLAALLAGAALLICGDTGVAHLATAFGTPSVLLFGPTPPAMWGPRTGGPHRVLWHGDPGRGGPPGLLGDPWGEQVDPTLVAITVTEVIAAAAELLDQRRSAGAAPGAAVTRSTGR
jgi:ADP-heptose:LPS heptosyltransferase